MGLRLGGFRFCLSMTFPRQPTRLAGKNPALAVPRVPLHFAPEDAIHVCLVHLPTSSKPGEHVGIHAEAHQLLDWPVETPDLDVRGPWISFGNIGKIDLRIGQSCDAP